MGQLSQTQLAGAIDSLLLRDTTVAAHVVKSDLEVDELERDVDARAIRVLALRQPIARDLRQVLAALRIGIEFERICDFAANIAKRAIALNAHSPDEWINELAELGQLALKLLADVVQAFRDRDSEQALDVWAHDEQLDDVYTGIYRRLIDFMKSRTQARAGRRASAVHRQEHRAHRRSRHQHRRIGVLPGHRRSAHRAAPEGRQVEFRPHRSGVLTRSTASLPCSAKLARMESRYWLSNDRLFTER